MVNAYSQTRQSSDSPDALDRFFVAAERMILGSKNASADLDTEISKRKQEIAKAMVSDAREQSQTESHEERNYEDRREERDSHENEERDPVERHQRDLGVRRSPSGECLSTSAHSGIRKNPSGEFKARALYVQHIEYKKSFESLDSKTKESDRQDAPIEKEAEALPAESQPVSSMTVLLSAKSAESSASRATLEQIPEEDEEVDETSSNAEKQIDESASVDAPKVPANVAGTDKTGEKKLELTNEQETEEAEKLDLLDRFFMFTESLFLAKDSTTDVEIDPVKLLKEENGPSEDILLEAFDVYEEESTEKQEQQPEVSAAPLNDIPEEEEPQESAPEEQRKESAQEEESVEEKESQQEEKSKQNENVKAEDTMPVSPGEEYHRSLEKKGSEGSNKTEPSTDGSEAARAKAAAAATAPSSSGPFSVFNCCRNQAVVNSVSTAP